MFICPFSSRSKSSNKKDSSSSSSKSRSRKTRNKSDYNDQEDNKATNKTSTNSSRMEDVELNYHPPNDQNEDCDGRNKNFIVKDYRSNSSNCAPVHFCIGPRDDDSTGPNQQDSSLLMTAPEITINPPSSHGSPDSIKRLSRC